MKTDIEHLHKVASGELVGRNIGKTYLKCHEVCGLIDHDLAKVIVIKMKKSRDINIIRLMLIDLMEEEYDITVLTANKDRLIVNKDYLTVNNFKIFFFTEHTFEEKIMGFDREDTIIVNFIDY